MIDLPFMCQECPSLLTVEELTVLYGDSGASLAEVVKERRRKGLVTHLHSPPLPLQWGTHHSKLIVLIYPDCLRLCVRTFNDIFPDVHQKCNAMYVQDFPLGATEGDFGLDFEEQLCSYFERCGGFDASQLRRFNFSAAAGALVASVPGYHRADEAWGQLRLRRLLAQHTDEGGEAIICQASSFGNLPKKWLEEFHTTLATCRKLVSKPPLQLVAPLVSQVRDSLQGWVSSVSLFLSRTTVQSYSQWRRWSTRRSRVEAMPHVKSYCRYATRGGLACVSWWYIGSHNLSKAAWGEVQKGGKQFCVRSYELGVLFFPRRVASLERDMQKQGFFWKQGERDVGEAVFISREASSSALASMRVTAVPIAFPTAVPPADPPTSDDPIWSRDWPDEVYAGLDRFGTKFRERGAEFYGYKALQEKRGRCQYRDELETPRTPNASSPRTRLIVACSLETGSRNHRPLRGRLPDHPGSS